MLSADGIEMPIIYFPSFIFTESHLLMIHLYYSITNNKILLPKMKKVM